MYCDFTMPAPTVSEMDAYHAHSYSPSSPYSEIRILDEGLLSELGQLPTPAPESEPPSPSKYHPRHVRLTPEATNALIRIVDAFKPYRYRACGREEEMWRHVLTSARTISADFDGCSPLTLRDRMNDILRHVPVSCITRVFFYAEC